MKAPFDSFADAQSLMGRSTPFRPAFWKFAAAFWLILLDLKANKW